MKSSIIQPVAVLATLGQATWPSPLRASNLTALSSPHPPIETLSLPSASLTHSSSSFQQPAVAHNLSSLPAAHNLSTHPPGPAISLSSVPTTHASSSHRRIVYHTLPSPPTAHSFSSQQVAVVHSLSSLSRAHNSSIPSTETIPLTGISSARTSSPNTFAANFSVVDIRPSATPCVCHGDHHDLPCCRKETSWLTITELVLIPVPTTVVDYDGKTYTVTKNKIKTVTTSQANVCTATVIGYKTHTTCKKPSPTTWDPPRRPIRPYPSNVLETRRKPGPTPWDPPRKPHGTVRPYPSDDKEKYHKATSSRTVFGPEATCPAGFTCQPDDDYVENKLVIREANVPWPAASGCANHCVGGRGCWTECDKQSPQTVSRICPEGYSCQRKKKPAQVPVPEPPKQQPSMKPQPAPKQQPAPPAVRPGPPAVPAPMPPAPPFVPPPVVQAPPAAPPPVVLPVPPPVSPPAVQPPSAAPPVVLPPPVLPPAAQLPPTASSNAVAQPPAAPAPPPAHVEPSPKTPPAPTHHCPAGMHPCPHQHANGTVGIPETVTKAGAGICMPAANITIIVGGVLGLFLV